MTDMDVIGADPRLDHLIGRLPGWLARTTRWLLKPSERWFRIPAGCFFILGGLLFILPVMGLWMLPLGIALLAEDIPWCRKLLDRLLVWIERRHPQWLQGHRE